MTCEEDTCEETTGLTWTDSPGGPAYCAGHLTDELKAGACGPRPDPGHVADETYPDAMNQRITQPWEA
jgi:hypothetical protein